MGDPNFPKSKLTDRDSGAIGEGGDKVSLFKILTFEQQRFACDFGKRVGKTVSEIKPCRMPALAKVMERLAREVRLFDRNGFDHYACSAKQSLGFLDDLSAKLTLNHD